MIESLLEALDKILSEGRISWGAIITALLFFNKIQRNKEFRLRDQRVERNQQRIMAKLGVEGEWASDLPPSGLKFIYLKLISYLLKAMKHLKTRRKKNMKAYLNKLGSRKFQAFILVTVCNAVLFIGTLTGNIHINDQLNQWMPLINLFVQAFTTIVYQLVQGSVDKEAQKQQVYVVPTVDPAPPVDVTEFEAQVEAVNAELNRCLTLIKTHDYADAPKEAIQLYTTIHALIKGTLK